MNVWRIKESFLWVYRSFDSANYAGRSRYFDRTVVARNTNLNGHFILPFWSGWADSNRRPPRPNRGALPTAPHPVMGSTGSAGQIRTGDLVVMGHAS